MPYRAKTKGKVERFNHYLKSNFYVPLKSSLKGSGIPITHQLLNEYIFSWLTYANSRIHATTGNRPDEMLKQELPHFSPIYTSIKQSKGKNKVNTNTHNSSSIIDNTKRSTKSNTLPHIDITYQTTLDDYREVLGGDYA